MSYKEWENTAESIDTLNCTKDTIRDTYVLPNKMIAYDFFVCPRHWGKPSYSFVILDFIVNPNDYEIKRILTKHNGLLNDTMVYTSEEMFIVPEFTNLEDAYNFALEVKPLN